jgi:2'-5' RNA ligase
MTQRIFTAIDISREARDRIVKYTENLRGNFSGVRVGWEKPEKLHLTLKFLGEASGEQIEKLKIALGKISENFSNFELQISETGVFPSPRNARILWLGLKDETGNLLKLNEMLESECERIGFARETRSFKPHLTIGRIREPQKSRELTEKHLGSKFEPVAFTASEIVVYESTLLPTGSIYSIVSKHSFTK